MYARRSCSNTSKCARLYSSSGMVIYTTAGCRGPVTGDIQSRQCGLSPCREGRTVFSCVEYAAFSSQRGFPTKFFLAGGKVAIFFIKIKIFRLINLTFWCDFYEFSYLCNNVKSGHRKTLSLTQNFLMLFP